MGSVLCQQPHQCVALNVILHEAEKALHKGYQGASFEGGLREIWISYLQHGCAMGQEQRYPQELWCDICLVMRLVGQLAHRHSLPKLVSLSEGLGFCSTRWSIFPNELGSQAIIRLDQLFRRVDEVMTLLNAPLE